MAGSSVHQIVHTSTRYGLLTFALCANLADCLREDPFNHPYNATPGIPLNYCSDGSFCCGANWSVPATKDGTYQCCEQKLGHYLVDGKVATTPASTSPTTATVTQPGSSKSSSPVVTSTPKATTSSTDTGAIVGGVVGGVAAVVVLGLALWYFVIRRKLQNIPQPMPQTQGIYDMRKQQMWQDRNGAPVDEFGGELEASAARTVELPSIPATRETELPVRDR